MQLYSLEICLHKAKRVVSLSLSLSLSFYTKWNLVDNSAPSSARSAGADSHLSDVAKEVLKELDGSDSEGEPTVKGKHICYTLPLIVSSLSASKVIISHILL